MICCEVKTLVSWCKKLKIRVHIVVIMLDKSFFQVHYHMNLGHLVR